MNIGELRGCIALFPMPHRMIFFFSFLFFLIQWFVRKELEGHGVGDSGFQFSIGCMGVGTQKGLILEQIRLNEMIHDDLSFFYQVVGKK